MLAGADVSNNNNSGRPLDWSALRGAGIDFALAKVSEGPPGYFVDATWPANLAGMLANDVLPGGYGFCRPDLGSAEQDYAAFSAALGPTLPAGLVLACDAERGLTAAAKQLRRSLKQHVSLEFGASANLEPWYWTWVNSAHDDRGVWPLFYSSPWFIQTYGLDTPRMAQCGIWIANWGVQTPWLPSNWQFWACWQYSDSGTLPGISGPVDLDYFNGTREQFTAYGIQAAPTPPPDPRVVFDDAARWQFVKWIAGGSGVADLTSALAGYRDP